MSATLPSQANRPAATKRAVLLTPEVVARVKAYRGLGFTQEQIEREVGISQTSVSKILRGTDSVQRRVLREKSVPQRAKREAPAATRDPAAERQTAAVKSLVDALVASAPSDPMMQALKEMFYGEE